MVAPDYRNATRLSENWEVVGTITSNLANFTSALGRRPQSATTREGPFPLRGSDTEFSDGLPRLRSRAPGAATVRPPVRAKEGAYGQRVASQDCCKYAAGAVRATA